MSELLTAIHPALVLAVALVATAILPRRVGHAIGTLGMLAVIASALATPEGEYLASTFLGFEVVFFNVDPFSRMMGLIFGIIGTAAVVYSYSSDASRVQTAIAISYVATSVGAVFAGDWLTLLFFWELMAITSTVLVWHYGGEAVRAGFRYAVLHGVGGSLLLIAVVAHYARLGTMSYADGIAPGVPAVLAALGIGVNVGFVGLHTWLPDTYPRPHIASSVFLCVYTTKTGVYALYRAFPDGALAIAYMGGAMALFGVTYALVQHDMRRLLSYHIQSQVGYMVAGVGIGTTLGVAGAMAHVYNHILYKALLFMAVGVLIYRTDREDLYELGGLWRQMPLTALVFGVGALSISGFPGFNGFVSKGIVTGAAEKKHLEPLFWMLLAGGVGTFLSFIKLGYYAFLHGESDLEVRDARPGQSVAMVVVAALCVLYGMYPDALFAVVPGTSEVSQYIHPFSTAHLAEGFAIAGISVLVFAAIKGPLSTIGHVRDVDALLNPATFYGGRTLMRAVTDAYAAVDAVAVRGVRAAYWIGSNPALAVGRAGRRLPPWLVETRDPSADGGNPTADPSRIHLRAGIGTAVLIVTGVLTLLLWLLL